MKYYYYFLYRIHEFYRVKEKNYNYPLLTTSVVSSFFISLNILAFYFFLEYKNLVIPIPNKVYIVILMIIVWWMNHFFIVKKGRFLKLKFKKDKKGGGLISAYILFSFIILISVGFFNRTKIFKQNDKIRIEVKKESLEGRIRKWFEE